MGMRTIVSRAMLLTLLATMSMAWAVGAQGAPGDDIDPGSMPICAEDLAIDVEPHRPADPGGPESACRRPDLVVEGPAKRAIPLDDAIAPSDPWLWPVEALRDLLFGGDGEGQLP